MSSLSDLLPAGASGKTIDATASGAIATKKPVILNSAGTVTEVAQTTTTGAIPEGAKAEILGTENKYADVAYDPVSGKAICIWRNNEGADEYGRLSIGTVSGTTITWNTSVVFDSTNLAQEYHTVAFDPNTTNSFVIHYSRSGSTWDMAGTVSGTTASVGTAVRVRTATSQGNAPTLAWNPNQAGEFAAIYKDDNSSDPSMYAYIGTVSGNTVTQGGTNLVPAATAHNGVAIAWNKGVNDEFVICYATTSAGGKIMAIRATVSGTSISYGTISTLSSLYSGTRSYISFDNNVTGSFVWQYWSYSEEDARSGAGTLSGDTWTFGTSVITPDSDADIAGNPLFLCPIEFSQTTAGEGAGCWYGTNGTTFGARAAAFSVSGTTLTWGASSVIDTGTSTIWASPRMSFNPQDAGSFITCNGETSAAGYDTNAYLSRIAITSNNLTATNFVGIADAAISNSASGTVVVQGGTATGANAILPKVIVFGSAAVFEAADIEYNSITFDSNSNKIVTTYNDEGNSSHGTAVVGTVSGTSISWGTPVVFEAASTGETSCTFDSTANKVVIAYRDTANSSYGTGIVGTVSGTAISYGSPAIFESAWADKITSTFDSNSNKVVVAYRDGGNGSFGTAVVGTVSGTSISYGTPVVFESASASMTSSSITFDSNSNKVVIAYGDGGNSSYGTAIVGTVSGTAISFGTAAAFTSAEAGDCSATFDSNSNKVVVAYKVDGVGWYGTAVVGTVSGTGISFGTPVTFEAATSEKIAATFDSTANKVVIAYKDGGNSSYGTAIVGTVSGTAISFDTAVAFESARSEFITATFDSNSNKVVMAYKDYGGSGHGESIVGTVGNDFTVGSSYYVTPAGSLSTVAGTPSVKAGLAISTTSLLLNGDS